MDKNKVLNKIDKLIKKGNDLLTNKEYYDVNYNSNGTGVTILSPNASGYRVDEDIFQNGKLK